MRRALLGVIVGLAVGAVIVFGTGAGSGPSADPTYRIAMDNAFGLVSGADFKVDGVPAGTISAINLNQRTLNAVITVKLTTLGIPRFHTSATCDSEPQSLIGEYFVSCQPGTSGPLLRNGATIPVTHTTSTIPADLVLNIMQVPERERLGLIINSLGAGVAARSSDIAAALDRALPALRDTDQLLALLDTDKSTLQSLTQNADTVVSALADNSRQIENFVTYANRAAVDTADRQAQLRGTLARLPGFLTQLRPDIQQLGAAASANTPALHSFNQDAGQLDTLLTALPSFANASIPAIRALGTASVTGKVAVDAAKTTVRQLGSFSVHVPELAKNLSIVTPALDTQSNATERNARAPGGKGYSGLQSLLQFAFNLAAATNYYGPTGHLLAVDGFMSPMCTPYATPQTIADNLQKYGAAYRSCYSWLGPNQPGVNETDPSNPSACVPDPGGTPTGQTVTVATTACKLAPQSTTTGLVGTLKKSSAPAASNRRHHARHRTGSSARPPKSSGGAITTTVAKTLGAVGQTLSNISGTVGGVAKLLAGQQPSPKSTATSTTPSTATTQSLLNYLLSP